jgi:hypothetical protein
LVETAKGETSIYISKGKKAIGTNIKRGTCAFCRGVIRQHIAVVDSMASLVKDSRERFRIISSAHPSKTNARSCIQIFDMMCSNETKPTINLFRRDTF